MKKDILDNLSQRSLDTECDELIKIYNKYFPIVLNLCKRYYFKTYDRDDLHQEALIVCFKSLRSYREHHQVSFGTFYKINLERHFCSLLRKEKSQKRIADSLSTSYEAFTENTDGIVEDEFAVYDIEDTCLSKIELTQLLQKLSDSEKRILTLHLFSQYKPYEIAQHLQINTNRVYGTLHRIKKKLKEQLYQ